MLENFVDALQAIMAASQQNNDFLFKVMALLVGIHLINASMGNRLCALGIYPRSASGLIGILFAPFLHGNFNHLLFNLIPFFILANLVLLKGQPWFYCVTAVIMVLSGLGTWLFGRKALHVGASSVIVGYWSYLLLVAYNGQAALGLILAFICVYYFGAIAFSILPTKSSESWEGHFFGLLAGIAAYFICPSLVQSFS